MKINLGFTLIELLIVIGIISLLSVGVLTVINPADQLAKANDARRKSDLIQIQKALEQYYSDNGHYPFSASGKIIAAGGSPIDWGSPWVPYIDLLPQDPSSPTKYYYYSVDLSQTGQYYYLYASLDRGATDPQACTGGGANNQCPHLSAFNIPPLSCGGTCNYGVTSPNTSP